MKLSDIYINPSNPRLIKDERFKKLCQSIKEFPKMMALRPIIVDSEGMILGGNMRFKALKELGYKEVPAEWVKRDGELTDAEKQRFIIADNIEQGEWDWDLLANEWDEKDLIEWGMDIPGFAFRKEAQEDDYEIPDEVKTDIVLGDLFEIGQHRLFCGDSTKADDMERLMNGQKADMVFTDPPYSSGGYQESGKTSGSIGARGNKKIATDNLSTRGYILLMDKVLANLHSAHSVFIFCDWKMWVYNLDISEAKGYRVRNMIVWDKMQMGMGMPFRNQHELILFGSKIAGKIGNGKTPNVLQYKRVNDSEHFTQKPVDLISVLLLQIEGDLICDPFIGSGSTMIASHQLNRKCYGMEIDPQYCQVIIDRMRKLDPDIVIKKNGKLMK